jgi:hypothetical protein
MPTNITHIPTNKSYYHIIHAYINRGKTCHPHENKQFHLTTPENFGLKEGVLPGLARAKPTLFLESNQIGEMECNFVFQPPLHKPPAPVTATVMVEDNLANRYRFSWVTFFHMFPVNDGYMNAYFPESQAKP